MHPWRASASNKIEDCYFIELRAADYDGRAGLTTTEAKTGRKELVRRRRIARGI